MKPIDERCDMNTLVGKTEVHQNSPLSAAKIIDLIERFHDFAHCNRADHITAGEAVAAYSALAELLKLQGHSAVRESH